MTLNCIWWCTVQKIWGLWSISFVVIAPWSTLIHCCTSRVPYTRLESLNHFLNSCSNHLQFCRTYNKAFKIHVQIIYNIAAFKIHVQIIYNIAEHIIKLFLIHVQIIYNFAEHIIKLFLIHVQIIYNFAEHIIKLLKFMFKSFTILQNI